MRTLHGGFDAKQPVMSTCGRPCLNTSRVGEVLTARAFHPRARHLIQSRPERCVDCEIAPGQSRSRRRRNLELAVASWWLK
eukprot:9365446-Alexandrium_andersonii.AAC.1